MSFPHLHAFCPGGMFLLSRMKRFAGLLGLLLWMGLPAPCAAVEPPAERFGALRAASLEILVDGRLAGSGGFISPAGLALTAAHVVRGGRRLEVLSPVAGRLGARVVATDSGHDLALLQVERKEGIFPSLDLAAAGPDRGTQLHAFGSVLYRHGLLLPGMVADERLHYEWNSVNRCYSAVQMVAAMTPEGLSGAPWVDGDGRLAGVQSGMIVRQGSLMGVAFMSPLEALRNLVASRRDAVTSSLGAQFAESWEWSPDGTGYHDGGHDGLYVVDALPGGALAAAGVNRGEMIVALDGVKVSYRDQLLGMVRKKAPGDMLTLSILPLEGERRDVQVKLAACGSY